VKHTNLILDLSFHILFYDNTTEAFKNVVRRLLEANGRGMWETDEDTLEKLRNLYSDADDLVEQIASSFN